MKDRTERRAELGLSQAAAASNAGLSLATWRRWEDNPDSVTFKTRDACERVLAVESELSKALAKSAGSFEKSWCDSARLTPRQAYAIALSFDLWADGDLQMWLENSDEGPLHNIGPFVHFDRRVMFHVGENRAWVEAIRERCLAISDEVESGVLPFDRPGAYIDELLIATALLVAPDFLSDMPEVFEGIKPRSADDEGDLYLMGDDDWDLVSDGFDDICRWDEWEVPLHTNHPLLPAILGVRHPFTWFDLVPATGPGYLQRLLGLVLEHDEA